MADNDKKTLYEILGVAQTATLAEIKAAHRALALELVSGKTGLPHDEIKFRLQTLDLALNTLSVPFSRDAYDAELAVHNSHTSVAAPAANALTTYSRSATYNPLAVANALVDRYSQDSAPETDRQHPLQIFSATASRSISTLKLILRIIGGIFVLIIVARFSAGMLMAGREPVQYAREKARAEDMVIIQDYYEKHGVRPADRAEAERLELEDRRKHQEQVRAEQEQKQQEEAYNRFVESSRQEGEQISRDLDAADARARTEEERERREAEWARQRQELQEQERERAEEAAQQRQQMQQQQDNQDNQDDTQN